MNKTYFYKNPKDSGRFISSRTSSFLTVACLTVFIFSCIVFAHPFSAHAGKSRLAHIVEKKTRTENAPYEIDLRKKYPAGFSFAALGDSGRGGVPQYMVSSEMSKTGPDFILHLGDVVYDRGRAQRYEERFYRPYKKLIEAKKVFYPVIGNHDYFHKNGKAFFNNFSHLPNRYYRIKTGLVDFFALDSNTFKKRGIDPEQLRWLRSSLGKSKARYKIVYMHHPLFSSGQHGDEKELIKTLKGLFEENGVNLVISGHEHNYERLGPLGGVHYVITGGGGTSLRPQHRPGHAFTVLFAEKYHFLSIKVSHDSLSIEAINNYGETIDTLVIEGVE